MQSSMSKRGLSANDSGRNSHEGGAGKSLAKEGMKPIRRVMINQVVDPISPVALTQYDSPGVEAVDQSRSYKEGMRSGSCRTKMAGRTPHAHQHVECDDENKSVASPRGGLIPYNYAYSSVKKPHVSRYEKQQEEGGEDDRDLALDGNASTPIVSTGSGGPTPSARPERPCVAPVINEQPMSSARSGPGLQKRSPSPSAHIMQLHKEQSPSPIQQLQQQHQQQQQHHHTGALSTLFLLAERPDGAEASSDSPRAMSAPPSRTLPKNSDSNPSLPETRTSMAPSPMRHALDDTARASPSQSLFHPINSNSASSSVVSSPAAASLSVPPSTTVVAFGDAQSSYLGRYRLEQAKQAESASKRAYQRSMAPSTGIVARPREEYEFGNSASGVSLARPGLGGRRMMEAVNSRPEPCPPRMSIADATVPRPEWREQERVKALNQPLMTTQMAQLRRNIAAPQQRESISVAQPTESYARSRTSQVDSQAKQTNTASVQFPSPRYNSAWLEHANFSFDSSIEEEEAPAPSWPTFNCGSSSTNVGVEEEADEDEMGLDELMASLQRRGEEEFRFIATNKKPVYASKSVRQLKSVVTREAAVGAALRQQASMPLGAAMRVKYQEEPNNNSHSKEKSISFSDDQEEELSSEWHKHHSMENCRGVAAPDATKMAAFELPINDLNDASLFGGQTSEVDTSAFLTANTTISVDNSYQEEEQPARLGGAFPRLSVGARSKKNSSVSEDMKEITLKCSPGDFTTIVLTFSNKKSKRIYLRPRAILVRFDRTREGDKEECVDLTNTTLGSSGSIFQVSPQTLSLKSGENSNIYITFSPTQGTEGIYGGALKIKSRGKSFVLLLRGEAKGLGSGRLTMPCASERFEPSEPERACAAPPLSSYSKSVSQASPVEQYVEEEPAQSIEPQEDHLRSSMQCDPTLSRHRWLRTWLDREKSQGTPDASNTKSSNVLSVVPGTLYLEPSTLVRQDILSTPISATMVEGKGAINVRNHGDASLELVFSTSEACLKPGVHRVTISGRSSLSVSVSYDPNTTRKGRIDSTPCSILASHLGYVMVSAGGCESVVDVRISNPSNTTPDASSPGTVLTKTRTSPGEADRLSSIIQLQQPKVQKERVSCEVFFRRNTANFGSVPVGSLARQRVDLCNSSNVDVLLYLSDPSLPFVLLHNEVRIKARSYVRIPIRFLPVSSNREYSSKLTAHSEDGKFETSILLLGVSSL